MPLHNQTARRSCALKLLAFTASLFVVCIARAEPWTIHKDRLPALAHKLSEAEVSIRHLLEEKKHTEDPTALHEIMHSMIQQHKALAEASKEYEAERLHVRFKHPDLASVLERQYKRYNLKSIEEFGKNSGFDSRLDRMKAKVSATFPAPVVQKSVDEHGRKPASTSVEEDDRPERVTLSK